MKEYESLKKQYPEYICLDQLHRICRIAKRSAKYLVESGIIPATDTGRKTWRWVIAIDDVIEYLRRRDQVGSMIPHGATSNKRSKNYSTGKRNSFAQAVTSGQEWIIVDFFTNLCSEFDDVLSVYDIAEITGLDRKTLQKLLKSGHIKSITSSPRYIVPKPYLLEFVITRRFINMKTNSERFNKILEGFEEWKKQYNKPHLFS